MRYLKSIFSVILLLAMSFLGIQIIINSKINQQLKKDSAELNHFQYGLFSVDVWKEKIAAIVTDEVEKLSLSKGDQSLIRKNLEKSLVVLIDKMNERMLRENLKTTEGKIKQTLMQGFVNVDEIKKGVPEYANAILKELGRPKRQSQIKGLIKEKMTEYLQETFDTRPKTERDRIIASYHEPDEESAKTFLKKESVRKHRTIEEEAILLIALGMVLFLMEAFSKKPLVPIQYAVLSLALLVLLIVGVTTPMIDMEAKISDLSFVLLNHKVEFKDQVLYFQSKSVLDVFEIMIRHKDFQMKLVGVLVVSFSVIFPVLKLISSLAYYADFYRARKYKIIQFFVIKSGKWSMADVLVVAIFMAYIGFNGILNSQLKEMRKAAAGTVELLTTNGTQLQPGFFIFFSYAILAMFLSGFLKSRSLECETKPVE